MRALILTAVMLSGLFASAQEFEGEIKYVHMFRYKQFVEDTGKVLKMFGNSSTYKYKRGTYKWQFNGSDLQSEYSYNKTGKIYDKYHNNDTFFVLKEFNTDPILKWEIKKNADTILGHPVDMIAVMTGKAGDSKSHVIRRIYYSKKFSLLPQHASHLKSFSNHKVFEIIRAVPLRIEYETQTMPFTVRYEAVQVNKRIISDSELALPKGAKIR